MTNRTNPPKLTPLISCVEAVKSTPEERQEVRELMDVLDQLDKKVPLHEISLPQNNALVLKSVLALDVKSGQLPQTNWLAPVRATRSKKVADGFLGEAFLVDMVFHPRKMKEIFPSMKNFEALKLKSNQIINTLLSEKRISPWQNVETRLLLGKTELSLFEISLLTHSPSSPLFFDHAKKDLTPEKALRLIKALYAGLSHGSPSDYEALPIFRYAKDFVPDLFQKINIQSLSASDFANVLLVYGRFKEDFQKNLPTKIPLLEIEEKKKENEKMFKKLFSVFHRNLALLNPNQLQVLIDNNMLSLRVIASTWNDLAKHGNEDVKLLLVQQLSASFAEKTSPNYSQNPLIGRVSVLEKYPLSDPFFKMTEDQSLIFLECLGNEIKKSIEKQNTLLGVPTVLNRLAPAIENAAVFPSETDKYIKESIKSAQDKIKDTIKQVDIARESAHSVRFGIKTAPSSEQAKKDKTELDRLNLDIKLSFPIMFSRAGYEKSKTTFPKKKM